MIEVTFTELALFVWALLATAYALRYRHERSMLGRILQQITEDPRCTHRCGTAGNLYENLLSRVELLLL